jgi:hypothetical protein
MLGDEGIAYGFIDVFDEGDEGEGHHGGRSTGVSQTPLFTARPKPHLAEC